MVAARTFVRLIKVVLPVIRCVGVHSMAVIGHPSMCRPARQLDSGRSLEFYQTIMIKTDNFSPGLCPT